MAAMKVFTLENLQTYDGLIKNYINTADAKSLKTVAIDGNTLKFYRVEEPVGETAPAYSITLPSTDISGLLAKLEGATENNVVTVGADGTVKDSGTALADLATKAEVEAVDGKADANATAIEAINNADTGILKTAQTYADGKVQDLADGQVATNKTDIATMKTQIEALEAGTYDDTEIRGLIEDNAEAIEAHKTAIDSTVATLVGTDTNKSVRTIANEELAAQLIPENAQESLDTLAEIATWIQEHPDDAAAMNLAIENLETLVGDLPEGITATTIVGYIQEAVAAEKTRAEGVESGLDTRVDALEGLVGEGYTAIQESEIQALFA